MSDDSEWVYGVLKKHIGQGSGSFAKTCLQFCLGFFLGIFFAQVLFLICLSVLSRVHFQVSPDLEEEEENSPKISWHDRHLRGLSIGFGAEHGAANDG